MPLRTDSASRWGLNVVDRGHAFAALRRGYNRRVVAKSAFMPPDVAADVRRLDAVNVPDQPRHLGCYCIRRIPSVMKTPAPLLHLSLVLGLLALVTSPVRAAETAPAPAAALPKTDANGNPLRRAPTGHVSNYDEAKVGTYTLPDPVVLQNGQPVRDADTWFKQRRPEIVRLYETEIYGRVPERAPQVTFKVVETDPEARGGMAGRKRIVARFGDRPGGPTVNLHLYLPAKAT